VTVMTAPYDAIPFRTHGIGSEATARSFASEAARDERPVEQGTSISSRDVIAAWVAAPLLGAACLALLAV